MNLSEQNCIITGAARGIGLALAQSLSQRGARVVMADVDAVALEQAEVPGALKVACDVTKAADVEGLANKAEKAHGAIAVWINNAGLARHRWIPDYTEAEIDLMLAVNLKGTILGSQSALRRMIQQKRGHIVNVISTASLRGIPSETVYCAAKWGVRGFTQGLQEEAAPHGVRVTSVLPGGVDTEFWAGASSRQAPLEKFLSPAQVADGVIRVLEMDDFCVVREIVLRSIQDSDFSVKPE